MNVFERRKEFGSFLCLNASDLLCGALPLPSGPGSSGQTLCLDTGLWVAPGICQVWVEVLLGLKTPGHEAV